MYRARQLLLTACILLGPGEIATSEDAADQNSRPPTANETSSVDFTRDIRPLLSNACYACHGPDEESRQAELRFDRKRSALDASSSGLVAIVPGNPEASELVRRITSEDETEQMPPPDSGKTLTDAQISLLRQWIAQGAPWKEHWAFVPPQKANTPQRQNPIDYFIQRQLTQHGLEPSPEADKETLIRRVTFDLTGLPPTLTEVDGFVADESPGAYERVVDRLLQSPHYGEHMARFWLDAARYGDTHGLHLDNYRETWPYRDWVANAFNKNMAYDQFAVEQLAGDLLPDPSLEQMVATGFCRCHVTTNEGGSIEQEVYVRNVVDRTSTAGTVFMGLTLGCAVCHDHKFDPISQKEFYQLFAFFNSLDGPALDGNVKDTAPVVHVPNQEQAASLASLQAKIEEYRTKRDQLQERDIPELTDWIAERRKHLHHGSIDPELVDNEGLVLHADFEQEPAESVENKAESESVGQVKGSPNWVDGRLGAGLELASHSYLDFGNAGDFQDDKPFSYGAWVKLRPEVNGAIIAKVDVVGMYKGYDLSVSDGVVSARITRQRPGFSITLSTKNAVLTPNQWHHVMVTYDGSKLAKGVVIYVNAERQEIDVITDSLKQEGGIRHSKPLLIGRRDQEAELDGGTVDEVRLYSRRLTDADVQAIFLSSQLFPALATSAEALTDEQQQMLRHLYLIRNDSSFIEFTNSLDDLHNGFWEVMDQVHTTLVFRERNQPRDAFVLLRGEYDQHGEKVTRRTPDCLPAMESELPRNRLGLAQWIVSDEHPLTSRVAVNRFWQQLFGRGLVETSEDFGSQGAPPSHPALLDWLAVEFRESGWDIKALMKKLVMSATYRQSSALSPHLAEQDPQNRLLARGPRFRLDAEMLRDQALAVSNLLVDKIGGPGVKPPQPKGLWHAVGYTSSNTANFVADTEHEKIHRRSLYTFFKRTSPPPEMSTFDAPSRESTCVRRERTNTPLQALLLLNDPQYFEAAQALARRALREKHNSPTSRAASMYRLCTAKHAPSDTLAVLVSLYEDQLAKYQQNDTLAQDLVGAEAITADKGFDQNALAAWTIVANLILNLDEVVTKN